MDRPSTRLIHPRGGPAPPRHRPPVAPTSTPVQPTPTPVHPPPTPSRSRYSKTDSGPPDPWPEIRPPRSLPLLDPDNRLHRPPVGAFAGRGGVREVLGGGPTFSLIKPCRARYPHASAPPVGGRYRLHAPPRDGEEGAEASEGFGADGGVSCRDGGGEGSYVAASGGGGGGGKVPGTISSTAMWAVGQPKGLRTLPWDGPLPLGRVHRPAHPAPDCKPVNAVDCHAARCGDATERERERLHLSSPEADSGAARTSPGRSQR